MGLISFSLSFFLYILIIFCLIVGFDINSQKHEIKYDDGDVEELSLSNEKIIWRNSPSTDSKDPLMSTRHRNRTHNSALNVTGSSNVIKLLLFVLEIDLC